jgi:hypothetical protein
VPRSLAPKLNESRLSRRVTVGLTTTALVGVSLLSGCGNAVQKQSTDTRPEPNASSEGARQVYPSAAPAGALPTASPNPGSGGDVSEPQLDPPTNGSLPR